MSNPIEQAIRGYPPTALVRLVCLPPRCGQTWYAARAQLLQAPSPPECTGCYGPLMVTGYLACAHIDAELGA